MLWATKQLISLNLSTLHNATAHYRPIRHYNALLTEVYWCKSTRKRYPGAKKTGGEIGWDFVESTGSVAVQSIYKVSAGEVIQISMWFWQYVADFFSSSRYQEGEVSSDDIMMTLQHKALHSVSSNVINYTTCPIPIYLHITPSSNSSSTLTADHTHDQCTCKENLRSVKKIKIPLIRHTQTTTSHP